MLLRPDNGDKVKPVPKQMGTGPRIKLSAWDDLKVDISRVNDKRPMSPEQLELQRQRLTKQAQDDDARARERSKTDSVWDSIVELLSGRTTWSREQEEKYPNDLRDTIGVPELTEENQKRWDKEYKAVGEAAKKSMKKRVDSYWKAYAAGRVEEWIKKNGAPPGPHLPKKDYLESRNGQSKVLGLPAPVTNLKWPS